MQIFHINILFICDMDYNKRCYSFTVSTTTNGNIIWKYKVILWIVSARSIVKDPWNQLVDW